MRDNNAYYLGRFMPKYLRIHGHDKDVGKIYSDYNHRQDQLDFRNKNVKRGRPISRMWREENIERLIDFYNNRTHPRIILKAMGITKNMYESKIRALIKKGRIEDLHIDWRKKQEW